MQYIVIVLFFVVETEKIYEASPTSNKAVQKKNVPLASRKQGKD
jgi:hypothetical protein